MSAKPKLSEFEKGALVALGLLMRLHDQPVAAADVLLDMSLRKADCSELDDFDKENLRPLNREVDVKLRGLGRRRRER